MAGRQRGSGQRLHHTAPIIAIFGAPAAGKTYWRARIAQHLDWSSQDIEDYGEPGSGRWTRLIDQLRANDSPVIVESCAYPKPYRSMLRRCPSLVIHVSVPRSTRWARLKEREPSTARAKGAARHRGETTEATRSQRSLKHH